MPKRIRPGRAQRFTRRQLTFKFEPPLDSTIPLAIPDWMVLDALRYAMGRMSTQPSITSAWFVRHWPFLPKLIKEVIQNDVEREFEQDDRMRKMHPKDNCRWVLGHDCDRASWEKVRALWRTSR
jgi:hypothetical protein